MFFFSREREKERGRETEKERERDGARKRKKERKKVGGEVSTFERERERKKKKKRRAKNSAVFFAHLFFFLLQTTLATAQPRSQGLPGPPAQAPRNRHPAGLPLGQRRHPQDGGEARGKREILSFFLFFFFREKTDHFQRGFSFQQLKNEKNNPPPLRPLPSLLPSPQHSA